jgi:hypothetical protein
LISNSIRASKQWPALMKENVDGFKSLADVTRGYKRLLRIAFGWRLLLLVLPVMALSFAAFFAPYSAFGRAPYAAPQIAPQVEPEKTAQRTKANPVDLVQGLIGDGATQILGAFFGVCGALLGGVIVRSGFSIRPMQVGFGAASRRRSEGTADAGV